MFASDDEFDKKLEEEKKKREETVQKKKELTENAKDIENVNLKDNWDDKEGYYCSYVGEIFGYKYRVVKENGKGVFSTVLCCVDTETSETMAIKVLRSIEKMTKDAKNELSLLEEIKSKDPQNTKHCIPVYKSFMYRNHLCIVFPYMALNLRDTLRKFGAGTGLSLIAVQSFGRQLFLALLHIKKLGIVHADIKPDNILLKDQNSSLIQLTDFGNSFHETDSDNLPTPYLVSRFYRAPEIILGLKYGGVDRRVSCRLPHRRLVCRLHAVRAVYRQRDLSRREQQRHATRHPEPERTYSPQNDQTTHQVVSDDGSRAHVH